MSWCSVEPNIDPILVYELGRDVLFGLSVLAVVLIFNGLCFTRVLFWYRGVSENISNETRLRSVGLFVASVLALAIVQLCAILIWALALFHADLIPTRALAILFSGSCYTTMGIYTTDILPAGWRLIGLFIAFSGLFSFTWTTSIMISMANAFTQAWDKSNKPKK